MTMNNLGNIVWVCGLMLGTADVMIWDQCSPSQKHGRFLDGEVAAHDGVIKGCVHTIVPYIGLNFDLTLIEVQKEGNDMHGFYGARPEHLFARLWQWRIVCHMWMGCATEVHGHVEVYGYVHLGCTLPSARLRCITGIVRTTSNRRRHHFLLLLRRLPPVLGLTQVHEAQVQGADT